MDPNHRLATVEILKHDWFQGDSGTVDRARRIMGLEEEYEEER